MFEILAGIGVGSILTFVLALLLMKQKLVPKITTILMLAAGAGLATVLLLGVNQFTDLANSITGIGAGIVSVITLVLFFLVVVGLWKKADNKTAWCALLLPAFAGLGSGAVATLTGSVSGSLNEASNALMGNLF